MSNYFDHLLLLLLQLFALVLRLLREFVYLFY